MYRRKHELLVLAYTKCAFQIVSIAHKSVLFLDIHVWLWADFLVGSHMRYKIWVTGYINIETLSSCSYQLYWINRVI